MELFKPDLFSRSDILFSPVTSANQEQIIEVIQGHYRPLDQNLLSNIEQLGGLEVNSNNFRLVFGKDQFILKRAGTTSVETTLELQYNVSERIRLTGVRLPEVVKNQHGKYVSQCRDGRNWILTKFVDGTYFSGHRDELLEISQGIGAMMSALKKMPPMDLPENVAMHAAKNFQTSFNRLMDAKESWSRFFPETDALLLQESSPVLREVGEFILNRLDDLATLPSGPCHIDLHPHNILVRDHKLSAIVDMDSFQNNRIGISLGFAVFKLIRQYAVHYGLNQENGRDIAKTAAGFFSVLSSHGQISDSEQKRLKLCAFFEVYRRLLNITDLNICKRDFVWNRVLSIQLAALTEIPVIFSDIS